jgi:uncharacterized membrane protein YhdT
VDSVRNVAARWSLAVTLALAVVFGALLWVAVNIYTDGRGRVSGSPAWFDMCLILSGGLIPGAALATAYLWNDDR